MWRSLCVYETSKDRFIAETCDASPTQAAAQANRVAFFAKDGARIVCEGAWANDPGLPADPLRNPRTEVLTTEPLRLDLSADRRPFETRQIDVSESTQSVLDHLFDAALHDLSTPVVHPDPGTTPMEVFALLDAALNPMMPELLEGSGLDHMCLFSGKAAQDLGEVAPWLVRLKPQHHFAQALIAREAPPVGLWPLQGAIFLNSRIGMPALRRNLRRFTRLEGEDGNMPQYFRFYAASVLRTVLPVLEQEMAQRMFAGIDQLALPGDIDGRSCLIVSRPGMVP